jgi:hypothetical protein
MHYPSTSHPPTATTAAASKQTLTPAAQTRLAEEATQALLGPGSSAAASCQESQPQHHSHHPPTIMPPASINVDQIMSSIPANSGMIVQHLHGKQSRRWYLGIQSGKQPVRVMNEVYKALLALRCEWLQLSTYRIKCKWTPNPFPTDAGHGGDSTMSVIGGEDGHHIRVPNLATPDYSIKIGLTLYKVRPNIYLLDFQKMAGDAFSFMTLCAHIFTELKRLSAASRLVAEQQAAAPLAPGTTTSATGNPGMQGGAG